MGWWDDFFDERYAQVWSDTGVFDRSDEEVAALVDLLELDEPADILDAPCGFGRHSGGLASLGHRVVGLDQSEDQLRLARSRNPGPLYLRGDMAAPPVGPFDVVLNLFSSLGYRCDEAADLAMLRAWHAALRPGGAVVIEGNHRDRLARNWTGEPFEWSGGAMEHPSVDWVSGIVDSRVVMADGVERHFRLRIYSATEMVAMLRTAGFVTVRALAGYHDPGPPTPDTRLLVLARTAAGT